MVEQPSTDQPVRRSERERRLPDFYGNRVNLSTQNPEEPTTTEEVSTCPEKVRMDGSNGS